MRKGLSKKVRALATRGNIKGLLASNQGPCLPLRRTPVPLSPQAHPLATETPPHPSPPPAPLPCPLYLSLAPLWMVRVQPLAAGVLRQNLSVCTSKASKLSTSGEDTPESWWTRETREISDWRSAPIAAMPAASTASSRDADIRACRSKNPCV